jgi:hypothetical protein
MAEILLYGMLFIIYFIPAILSTGRENSTAITALNFFLGWTFIGWVGALIWAIMAKPVVKPKQPLNYDTKISYCPYCKTDTKSIIKGSLIKGNQLICFECKGVKDYL